MNNHGERLRGLVVKVAVALAGVSAFVLLLCLFFHRSERNHVAHLVRARSPRMESVALANRTIQPSDFDSASEPLALSPRGTAAYALACAVPVTREVRERAAGLGARVIGYLPRQALLVEATPKVAVRVLSDPTFAGAVPYLPADKVRAGVVDGDVTVVPLAVEDRESLKAFVLSEGGSVLPRGPSHNGSFGATVSKQLLATLASRGDVLWIDRKPQMKTCNDYAVVDTKVANVWDSLGLTGKGQVIATADTGIDTGVIASLLDDFDGRVTKITNLGGYTTADYHGHGTHTAGTLVGTGYSSDGRYKGVAYKAKLYVQSCGSDVQGNAGIFFSNAATYDDIFAAGISSGAYIHSDSWGGGDYGVYEEFSQGLDNVTWRHPDLLCVIAAGNSGSNPSTMLAPGVAKNALTVGNCYSSRTDEGPEVIYDSSSRGPCSDGRIKPDIVAPGANIVSCRTSMRSQLGAYDSDGYYTKMSGTSMSTPHVAGCAALVREWLMEQPEFEDVLPSAALLKAILTGGAEEMKSNYTRMVEGFGRVNLSETLAPSNRCVKLHDMIPFGSGIQTSYSFTLTNAAPFEAQLVWIDYPAEPSAAMAIVNDLDLIVVNKSTGEYWYGNGVIGGDRTNTVEAVRIASAEPGEYSVVVSSANVPYDSTEGGAAALYVRGAFSSDDGDEVVPGVCSVSVYATGPAGISSEDISPLPGATVEVPECGMVVCKAPNDIGVTNRYGRTVAWHTLGGWTVDGSDCYEVDDDGVTVSISIVATNDVDVTWHYWDEAEYYALYLLFSARDRYSYMRNGKSYDCYIDTDGSSLYSNMIADAMWVANGTDVNVTVPGGIVDEASFSKLYYSYKSWGGTTIRNISLSSPFVLKLGAVSVGETDEEASYATDEKGVMLSNLEFVMDGPKDVIGYYWNASNVVSGSTLPYWWYMRNLYTADVGGPSALSSSANPYTTDEGDPDGDGFGNRWEYDEGTVPVDSLSFPFRVLDFSPTNIVWLGGTSAGYVLESSDSLSPDSEWTSSSLGSPNGGGSVTNSAAMPSAVPSGSRFFRVRVAPSE